MDDVAVFDYEGVPIVAVSGDLDIVGLPELHARLRRLVDAGHVRLVVDLDHCDFVDCGGLGALVGHLTEIRSRNGELAVVCTRRRILRIFKLTGLDQVFSIASTHHEALSALTRDSAPDGQQPSMP